MRILLLNPPTDYTSREFADDNDNVFIDIEDFGFFPPNGLLYIYSYLKTNAPDHDLYFHDCLAEHLNHRMLAEAVERIKPDIVGLTSYSAGLYDAVVTSETVRRIVPKAHICIGGPHAMSFPCETAMLPAFDSVIIGEGEEAFFQLVTAIEKGEEPEAIAGVITKNNADKIAPTFSSRDDIVKRPNLALETIDDLDALPFPDRKVIEHLNYRSIVGASGKFATLVSSRGCPFKCTFCDVPYKKYRMRSTTNIVDEIEMLLSMGYEEIHFYDDLFNFSPERILSISEEILRRRLKFVWSFRGRVSGINDSNIQLAKKAGLRMVTFGVETGSDENLRLIKKGITVKQIRNAFAVCRRHFVKTIADFIIGLPFEDTKESIRRNLKFLMALNPDFAQISILGLYPHTEVFDRAVERGYVDPERWRKYVEDPYPYFKIDHWSGHFDLATLTSIQRRAYRQFYLRPGHILRSISTVRSWYEFKAGVQGLLKLVSG